MSGRKKPPIAVWTIDQEGRPWQYAEARDLAEALDVARRLKDAPRSIDWTRRRERERDQLRLFDAGRIVWIAPRIVLGKGKQPPVPRIGPCGDALDLWFLEFEERGQIFRRYYADAAEAAAKLDAMKGGRS